MYVPFVRLPSVRRPSLVRVPQVDPCTRWVRDVGSMFTAAVWVNLACLLDARAHAAGTNIALFRCAVGPGRDGSGRDRNGAIFSGLMCVCVSRFVCFGLME